MVTPPSACAANGARRAPRGVQAGFSLVDVMVASTIMLIVVLGHVASTMAQHELARVERTRSSVLRTAGRFVERLRSDEDWAGLYARLRLHQSQASSRGIQDARLEDGRPTYLPSTYIPGFTAPSGVTVLVDVPHAPDATTGENVLREDVTDAELLLPSDLNGDGAISTEARDLDYQFLPLKTTFRWRMPEQDRVQQLTVITWLRGSR
jgi:hypothetical protein